MYNSKFKEKEKKVDEANSKNFHINKALQPLDASNIFTPPNIIESIINSYLESKKDLEQSKRGNAKL